MLFIRHPSAWKFPQEQNHQPQNVNSKGSFKIQSPNQMPERATALPKVTQLVRGRAGTRFQAALEKVWADGYLTP